MTITRSLNREERIMFCGIIGMLLLEDRLFTNDERRFLEALMREHQLEGDDQQAVYEYARGDHEDARHDIEHLRRSGHSDALLATLREAALADGVIQDEEQALMDSVDEIIRLRLGAERYPVSLHGLDSAPLDELYEIGRLLGQGGFGQVYAATERKSGRAVVIKRLRARITEHASAAKRNMVEDRFWREVAILSRLSSPYSVRLLGAGFDVSVPYMVLELIDGQNLYQLLQRGGAFDHERTRRVMGHVLHAIADAHTKGVIHRDLKPENVMVSGAGSLEVARVLDFGLAGIMREISEEGYVTLTHTGDAVGTPSYMAPEQITELHIKRPANDIYALGLLLIECVTGETAVTGSMREVVRFQTDLDTPVPLPEPVQASPFALIIERACQKDWQARYANAVEMLEAFQDLRLEGPDITRNGRVWTRLWSGLRRMMGGA